MKSIYAAAVLSILPALAFAQAPNAGANQPVNGANGAQQQQQQQQAAQPAQAQQPAQQQQQPALTGANQTAGTSSNFPGAGLPASQPSGTGGGLLTTGDVPGATSGTRAANQAAAGQGANGTGSTCRIVWNRSNPDMASGTLQGVGVAGNTAGLSRVPFSSTGNCSGVMLEFR